MNPLCRGRLCRGTLRLTPLPRPPPLGSSHDPQAIRPTTIDHLLVPCGGPQLGSTENPVYATPVIVLPPLHRSRPMA